MLQWHLKMYDHTSGLTLHVLRSQNKFSCHMILKLSWKKISKYKSEGNFSHVKNAPDNLCTISAWQ